MKYMIVLGKHQVHMTANFYQLWSLFDQVLIPNSHSIFCL